MSSLFRIDLPGQEPKWADWLRAPHLAKQCASFLDTFVRQNAPDVRHIRLLEHLVTIKLTTQERVLYMSQARDAEVAMLSRSGDDQNDTAEQEMAADDPESAPTPKRSKTVEHLLKLCSHFQAGSQTSKSAEAECHRIFEQKERRVVRARNQMCRCWRVICILKKTEAQPASPLPGSPNDGGGGIQFKVDLEESPVGDGDEDLPETSVANSNLWRLQLDCRLRELAAAGASPQAQVLAAESLREEAAAQQSVADQSCFKDLEHHEPRDPDLRQALGPFRVERQGLAFAWRQLSRHLVQDLQQFLAGQVAEQLHNLHELQDAMASLEFFRRTLRLLRENASPEERQCSICLDEGLALSKLAITPCSHVFCLSCLRSTVEQFKTCSICRTPLKIKDVAPVLGELQSEKNAFPSTSSSSSSSAARYGELGKYGSKIAEMIKTLKQIRVDDPLAKIIVFSQFDDIKIKLRSAFEEFGLPVAILQGSASRRDGTILQWQNDPQALQYILLLSLEHSASGTNLTAASHVMLVHPMLAATSAESISFEKQAIGRARRYGQMRDTVHVWRSSVARAVAATIVAKVLRVQLVFIACGRVSWLACSFCVCTVVQSYFPESCWFIQSANDPGVFVCGCGCKTWYSCEGYPQGEFVTLGCFIVLCRVSAVCLSA
ncbi:unnamed protein product [Polarella glacialis]|uniref:RING-type domain-containing protein n=1 Tax=Polarella glacialis TaxID=89957 RepID=A0A813FT66_POLGL|nr:unnamed protein product [Polarella glacialis]